jgi:hypothetical protein
MNAMTPDVVFLARRLRWLTIYAAALTVAVVVGGVVLATRPAPTRFEHIVVERVDVVEPGGMKRMMLTSAGRFPADYRSGAAGMLFFNSDGIENGGLMINGTRGPDGQVDHAVQLSMDRYDQDQTVVVRHVEGNGTYFSGLYVQDRPATPMAQWKAEYERAMAMAEGPPREEALAALKRQGPLRGVFGRDRDESALLALSDGDGRVRARLRVTKEGDARLEFLDEAGAVAASYPQSPPQ